jgi:hypothetical protein
MMASANLISLVLTLWSPRQENSILLPLLPLLIIPIPNSALWPQNQCSPDKALKLIFGLIALFVTFD